MIHVASIGSFFDAIGSFFDSLSRVGWGPLALGAIAFVVYLTLRARAFFNTLRAAYPSETIAFRRVWGAYIASYGFNNVIPARGGDVIKLFLVKGSIPNATYPAVGAAICVEAVFDAVMAVFILAFAFSQGVFPKPPEFADLGAFDLSFFASHPQFTLFAMTLSVVIALVGFAVLSQRVKAFWARVRQGLTILRDRRDRVDAEHEQHVAHRAADVERLEQHPEGEEAKAPAAQLPGEDLTEVAAAVGEDRQSLAHARPERLHAL